MNHFTHDKPLPCSIGDMSVNANIDQNWTNSSSFHITCNIARPGVFYMEWIEKNTQYHIL